MITLAVSCTPYRKVQKIRSGEVGVELSVSDEKPCEDAAELDEEEISLIKGSLSDGPVIMNAIRDTETGDMVATDVISGYNFSFHGSGPFQECGGEGRTGDSQF